MNLICSEHSQLWGYQHVNAKFKPFKRHVPLLGICKQPKDTRAIDPNLTGKFMLFIDKNKLDEKWKVVKEATEGGFLSYSSKCSTAKESPNAIDTNKGLICIYTASIYDMGEIKRVECAIRKIVKYHDVLYYKGDIQTMTETTDDKLKITYLYKFEGVPSL